MCSRETAVWNIFNASQLNAAEAEVGVGEQNIVSQQDWETVRREL